jgi:hypothetical protein
MSKAVAYLISVAVLSSAPFVFTTVPAQASTIISGPGSYGVAATTAAAEPDLAGSILEDRLQPFTINGSDGGVATGTIQERVVRSNDTGFLHFYSRVIFDTISGFEPGSYVEWLDFNPAATGNPLAVGRRTDGLGTATSSNYDLAGTGQSRFDFNLINLAPANAGFSTQFHYLKSNATNYALNGQLKLSGFEFIGFNANGISSPWLSTWGPSNGVPEMQSWAMMIAGFGAVGAAMRRRRRVAVVAQG